MADLREQRPIAKPLAPSTRLLSCVSCRAGKVKCNKVFPCQNCQKSQIQCIFPEGKRNRRPRETRQRDLLTRISRLEAVAAKVDPNAFPDSDVADSGSSRPSQPGPVWANLSEQPNSSQQDKVPPSQPPDQISQPRTHYLGAHLWKQLCGEIDGLKQYLDVQSDSEDDLEAAARGPDPETLPASYAGVSYTSHAIFANPALAAENDMPHPSPKVVLYLCDAYFAGVDVVLKILHRPSLSKIIDKFTASGADPTGSGISKATEALLFAIYFGAITSMSPEMCLADLGETRAALAHRYRLATEIALAKADYLNSSQLEPLQAFAIYIAVLRSHDGSRASWALLSLLIRLAQSLGLHRDGDGSSFAPFEAEMRRRLWWALVILDMRAAEDRGAEPIVTTERFDTQLPTNIDDAEFGPESITPLAERDGPSEITINLCLAMCSAFHLEISRRLAIRGLGIAVEPASDVQSDGQIISYVQRLEARFIDGADRTHPVSCVAARTVRLIVLKLWLDMQYPIRALPVRAGCTSTATGTCSRVSRQDMLRTAGLIMELAEYGESAPEMARFCWWCATYVQWHALAVALAELCTQTQGEAVERAWRIIDTVFQRWSLRIADSNRGMLWRPIRKLYKKAKAARSAAMAGLESGTGNAMPSSQEAQQDMDGDADHPAAYANFDLDELSLPDFIHETPDFVQSNFGHEAWTEQEMPDWIDWKEFVNDASNGVDM